MGALVRSFDWSATPLGPVEQWSQSLRTTVSTCLNSRFPILVWWGPGLVMLYNDGYRQMLGAKHPRSLGGRGREVWAEIWPIIGPMLDGVLTRGEATWSENTLLVLERKGFPEETYFTFSYSPIRDESGGIGGVFTAVTETTANVLGERRLRTLRELAESSMSASDVHRACVAATEALAKDRGDVRFALIYLVDPARGKARLAGSTGVPPGMPWSADEIDLAGTSEDPFRITQAVRSGETRLVEGLQAHADFAARVRTDAQSALVLPVARADEQGPAAVLVIGLSPLLALDEPYRGFLALVAGQLATALATARSVEVTRRRAEALAELDRAKTVFFSNVSHEFRTPLTLLLGPLEELLLGEETLSPSQSASVRLAHRNGLRLLKLVNTLLDFARIEAGRIQASYEPTDLARLTIDLASMFKSSIERAGLRLRIECPPLSELVYVDRDMWEKIVLNLVSNAFKFTLEGEIAVVLRKVGRSVELVVEDTGTGIPANQLDRVFERFHRVEGARGRSQEGTGIGLSLVQELARLHGGSIRVESTLGKGSRFFVVLPLGTAHVAEARMTSSRPPPPQRAARQSPFVAEAAHWLNPGPAAGQPSPADRTDRPEAPARGDALLTGRILLADDNADMRSYVQRILEPRWTVETAADGQLALEAVRKRPPDLVVSDVMMPNLDGFGLLKALRDDPATAGIPVILLSARAGEEAHVEGREAGADDYLIKPFSARELAARVQSQLVLSRLRNVGRVQRDEFQRLFMAAPVFMCLLRGPDHVFELANAAYLQLIGQREVIGKTVREALPELTGQGFLQLLDRVYATGQEYVGRELPVRLQRAPGAPPEELFLTFNYEPFRDLNGRIDGVVVFGFDVTETVLSRKKTETLAEQAQLADRRKDEFLAMLGHELRNPLAPIFTALQLMKLRDQRGSERERQVIERQVTHLSRLVDDLLDVARIARGKIDLQREPVELGEVAAKALEMASPLLEQREHRLRNDVPRAGLRVLADPVRLAQVVANLLTNAAKYTAPRGQIVLSAVRKGREVLLSVQDDGIGISAELLPYIFDLFVQGRRTFDRAEGGLGLGLALVKNLVSLHGGSVLARSDGPGQGSEFVVRLPALDESPTRAPQAPEELPGPLPGRQTKRILVVDDNEDAAEMLAELLRSWGHHVVVAHDGPQALKLQASEPIDVGLLDLGLPVMDGFELARHLRELSGPTPLRLIAVTGYGQESDRALTRAAGFDLHLVKPIDLAEVLSAIDGAHVAPRHG